MNIFDNINFDRFLFSLQYMWKGMLAIFIVMGVIILSVFFMNFLIKKFKNRKKEREE